MTLGAAGVLTGLGIFWRALGMLDDGQAVGAVALAGVAAAVTLAGNGALVTAADVRGRRRR
jgi:hypothetical protein